MVEEEQLEVFHLQLVCQEVQEVELRVVEQLDQEFLVKVTLLVLLLDRYHILVQEVVVLEAQELTQPL